MRGIGVGGIAGGDLALAVLGRLALDDRVLGHNAGLL